MPTATGQPAGTSTATLDTVLAEELEYLRHHRYDDRAERFDHRLVGLALSGGGIRAATTSLGVLQALSAMRILPLVDYLCTVSGGGYIGGCLSSLLSINHERLPTTPADALDVCAARSQVEFGPGDRPAFGTAHDSFPLRTDREGPQGELATDLVAHLRTHGNFLVVRHGLFRRDTMRAVGNLVTGTTHNLVAFALLLLVAAAAYLGLARIAMPGAMAMLDRSVLAPASAPLARPDTVTLDATHERVVSFPCTAAEGPCAEQLHFHLSQGSPLAWLRYEVALITTSFGDHPGRDPFRMGGPAWVLLFALALGGVASWIMFRRARSVGDGAAVPGGETPASGESQEEQQDRGDLRGNARVMVVFLLLSFVGARLLLGRANATDAEEIVLLLVPLAFTIGARAGSYLLTGICTWILRDGWNRRFRSRWGGCQAICIYGIWITLSFALLIPMMYAFSSAQVRLAIGGTISLGAGRVLLSRLSPSHGGSVKIPGAILRNAMAVVMALATFCGVVYFGGLLVGRFAAGSHAGVMLAAIVVGGTLVWVAGGFLVDHNKLSPHYFYRDRLAETYLLSAIPDSRRALWVYRDAMEMKLADLHGHPRDGVAAPDFRNRAPYHLVSAAINLAGSRDLTRKDRKSGYWLFSKLYCGSVHTGFARTAWYRRGSTTLGTAMTISGAAASSAIGFMTFFAQSFATVLFNVRLGYWMENPAVVPDGRRRPEQGVFWPWYLLKEATMSTTESDAMVNLSDGGHTGDNVGIYPLFQRRCKVIIAFDAEQDPHLSFGSFTEVLRQAYVDMGIAVDIDLSMIRPDPVTGRSRSHCAVGRIDYPDRRSQDSYLIYMKNSLTGDEQEPVLNYKVTSAAFPHEPTADLFFSDAQFESYRSLGVHIAESVFGSWTIDNPLLTLNEEPA